MSAATGDEEISSLISANQQDNEIQMVSMGNSVHLPPSQSSCSSVCPFSSEEIEISESKQRWKSAIKLSVLIIFYLIVMLVEIVGGIKANSLAIITDAVHLLTDVAGYSVSLFTVWASGLKANGNQSFGYSRLEVFGALISVQLIWVISGSLIYEAIIRFVHTHSNINGSLMFSVAAFGFVVNIIMVTWLGHDHSHHGFVDKTHDHCHHNHAEETTQIRNINLQGAYLHVISDLIQSFGVMIAGAVIWAKPNLLIVDLICAISFAAFALSTTLPMVRDIYGILMEKTPCEIDVARLECGLKCIDGVRNVHDLHVWAITAGKYVLSCHLVAEAEVSSSEILCKVRDYCEKTYKIHHITVQIEQ